jgi:hypothetical protein
MDEQGVFEAARVIRSYLPMLVGPAAGELDRQIAELLNTGSPAGDCAKLRSVLDGNEATGDFLAEVLADAPEYRPLALQPGHIHRGGGDYQALAGDAVPVLHTGRFACPHGDYVWYRPTVGAEIPGCPTHGLVLTRGERRR